MARLGGVSELQWPHTASKTLQQQPSGADTATGNEAFVTVLTHDRVQLAPSDAAQRAFQGKQSSFASRFATYLNTWLPTNAKVSS